MKKILSLFIVIFVIFLFVGGKINADDTIECKPNETQTQCESRLRAEIARKEAEIKRYEQNIKKEKGNQKNLSGLITKLKKEISKTSLAIQKKNIILYKLKKEINNREKTLQELNDKLRREKESLEKILRKRYELSNMSLFEFFLSLKNISQFYADFPAFSSVQTALSHSFENITKLKYEIYGEKTELEKKKEEENNERYSLSLEKGKIENQKKQRDQALRISKSKEASLAKLKKIREEEIKKIRSALIKFRGNGMSRSISFGEAYDYAKETSQKTGVRTAFIMAIMQQESGFGRNVGGCYLTKKPVGLVNGSYQYDGIYIKSGKPSKKNMIPNNFDAFLRITSALGRDWKKTPISCAVYKNGKYYGYGGAMGYTQFIPNSWELVSNRIRSYLRISAPNPWNPEHAVMATGIFLADKGAKEHSYTAEYNAACRYYGSCSYYNYGKKVMEKALLLQKTIDFLENNKN